MSEKTVHLEYFAGLREERGTAEETVETTAGTPAELYEELAGRHGLEFPRESLRVAINDDFESWDSELSSGDQVVFIPPVAGGKLCFSF